MASIEYMNNLVDKLLLKTQQEIQSVDVKNIPVVIVSRMLYEKLNATLGKAGCAGLVGEIVTSAKINVSQYIVNNHRDQLEKLVDMTVDFVMDVFNQLRMEYDSGFIVIIMRRMMTSEPLSISMDI